jgi:uncharacterized glyoxalase superfamily protein PhnB
MSLGNAAVFEAAIPILSVIDLPEALDYYQNVLAFRIGWSWGEPPRLASVCRDRVEVNLSQSPNSHATASRVYFQIAGVDAYYNQVTIAGANVVAALADRPYGMKDFRIVDPSGNQLSFGEATAT